MLINQAQAQNLKYEIFRGDSKIGKITVSRAVNGEKELIDIVAEVEFRVIFKYQRSTQLDAAYKNGKLISAFSKTVMNDELKELSEINWKDGHYDCFKHPDQKYQRDDAIKYSAAKLYFEEPKGIDQVFSESYIKYCELINLGNHKYKLLLPDDKVNYYTYSDGNLVDVLIDRSWFDITFKLVQ